MNLAETQQLYDTTPNCCRWRDSSRKESWDAGELLVCKRSTVTHKSSQPDPTSRFTAPVPADFPAKMGVTVPCASLCPPPRHCHWLSTSQLIVIPAKSQRTACTTHPKQVNSCPKLKSFIQGIRICFTCPTDFTLAEWCL